MTTRSQPEIGGIESHVAEVAGRIAALGYDLELLTTDRSGTLPKTERVDGYLVRRFRAYPAGRDWYFSPGLFWAALRGRYDLVHVQGIHTLVPPLAMIAAILRRTPFLLTFHTGGNSSAFRERARRTQFRIVVAAAAPRPTAGRRLGLRGPPVRGDHGAARRRDRRDPQRRLAAAGPDGHRSRAGAGRQRGPARALQGTPPGHRGAPAPAGERGRRRGSRSWAPARTKTSSARWPSELGVADRVRIRFIPPVDRALMGECIARAGVMTLLSDYEAHPVAVMEALTAGRPAVISRTSGLTELAELGWARRRGPGREPRGDGARDRATARRPGAPGPRGIAHMGHLCC